MTSGWPTRARHQQHGTGSLDLDMDTKTNNSQDDPPSPVPGRPSVSWWRHWIFATLMLCSYGFFKEFKPSEPFLTPYLTSEVKNFTKTQLNSEVWSYSTYSYLIASLFTLLLTDFVRYKPVIVLESGCYLATRLLLIWGMSIASMQWMQVAYGIAEATEIAYYSYIYAAVSVTHFKKVTSYVRAIRLFGQSMSSLLGQVLISTGALGYLELNYISLASVSLACIISLFLPNVFNCSPDLNCCTKAKPEEELRIERRNLLFTFLSWIKKSTIDRGRDFAKFYCVPSLLKWSLWWALATCGVLQIGNYVQSLWKEVADENEQTHEWNGLVEAIATLCSAAAAFFLSFVKVDWSVWGEITIGLMSLLDSAVLLFASSTHALWGVYLCHIIYRTTYAFLITIASTQLALSVDHESYALIFGFNSFIALVLQTILTLVVADEHGLDLDIRTQFVVYSGYYYVLTVIFIGAGVYRLTRAGWIRSCLKCCHPNSKRDEDTHRDCPQPVLRPMQATIQDNESIDSTNKLI